MVFYPLHGEFSIQPLEEAEEAKIAAAVAAAAAKEAEAKESEAQEVSWKNGRKHGGFQDAFNMGFYGFNVVEYGFNVGLIYKLNLSLKWFNAVLIWV